MALWTRGSDCSGDDYHLLADALEDLNLPIFVIDAELSVLTLNQAARNLLDCQRGLAVVQGQLRVTRPEHHDVLVRLIGRIAGNPGLHTDRHGLELGAGDETLPLHLSLRALSGGGGIARGSRIVMYVIDPQHQPNLDGDLLRRVYHLSPAEIRVVHALMQGHSVEAIAELLSISVYTVRTHLKNLFAKTGVNRQGELIARVAASLSSLRGPENPLSEGCGKPTDPLNLETSSNSSETPGASRTS